MTRVMSSHKYRLSQVSLFLCLVMLMSTMRRVHTHTTCINNPTSSSKANMNCTHPPGRIQVLSLLYAHFRNQTQTQTCPGSVQEVKCSQIMERGNLLKNNTVFSFCSSESSCSEAIKREAEAEEHQSCSKYNYFLANYTCVEEIMDLCGDETWNLTSPTHLGDFSSVLADPIKNCTCMVQGRSHQLIAVDVAMPQTTKNNCTNASVKVVWSPGDGGTNRSQIIIKESEAFTNQYLVNNSDITWIYYTRNCTTITQRVWFKLQSADGSQATIYCGKSIPNSTQTTPTLVTQSSNTTPEWTTLTNVPSHTTMTSITEPSENVTIANDTSSMTNSTTLPPVTTENQTEMSPPPSPMSSTAVTTNSTSNSSAVKYPTFNTDSSSQDEVIVGSVIGAFFVVVIALVLVIVFYRRHKSRKNHPLSNGANTARYENTSADLPLVAMGPSPHKTGYDHIAAVGIVQGDDNSGMSNNTGNVYNHTLDEEEYDHIQTVATVHPSSAILHKQPDDTYNNLYEIHNSNVHPKGDNSLSESTTDMNDPNSDANDIYSQIQDKSQSEEPGSDTILHKSHEETKEEFVENDLYQSVDECETDQSPTQHAQGGQGLHSYHVLEKDFGLRVPENPPHSADKDVYKDETPSSTPHKSHDLTNEETEFVENDLYQSVDQCDTDKSITQHARGRLGLRSYHVLEKGFGSRVPENPPHSVDKDVYKDETPSSTPHKSHDLTNEETEFVENDLYQSVDQCDTDKSINQHARGRLRLRSYHVLEKDFGSRVPENPPHSADKDVYKDETPSSTPHKSHDLTNEETEFVENDLYQSADQL